MSDDTEVKNNVEVKDNPQGTPEPTEYQKQLIRQWYDGGHRTQPPFALGKDGQLVWMNRKERKAHEARARRRK